jgi:hypothetical protein
MYFFQFRTPGQVTSTNLRPGSLDAIAGFMDPAKAEESEADESIANVIKSALDAEALGATVLAICQAIGKERVVVFEGEQLSKVLARFRCLDW